MEDNDFSTQVLQSYGRKQFERESSGQPTSKRRKLYILVSVVVPGAAEAYSYSLQVDVF